MCILDYKTAQIQNSEPLKRQLQQLYESIFHEQLTITCGNCIEDAIFRIKYFYKQNKTTMEAKECSFKIKEGRVLWIKSLGIHLTNDNITDEIAVKVLQQSVKNISNFVEYPENWKELVSGKPVAPKRPQTTKPVDEPVNDLSEDEVKDTFTTMEKSVTVDSLCDKYSKEELQKLVEAIGIEYKKSDNKTTLALLYINNKK